MKVLGGLLMFFGLMAALASLAIPTTAGISTATGNIVEPELRNYGIDVTEVANLAGQHVQLVVVLAAGFLFVAGAVLYVGGEIAERLPRPQ